MIRPTVSQFYYGLRSVGNTLQRWYWVEDFRDEATAGWGWHGQSKESSGFAFTPREKTGSAINEWSYSLMFCRTYGRRQALTDKIKVEDVRPLIIDRLPEGITFEEALSLRYWRRSSISLASWVKLPENLEAGGLDCRSAANRRFAGRRSDCRNNSFRRISSRGSASRMDRNCRLVFCS